MTIFGESLARLREMSRRTGEHEKRLSVLEEKLGIPPSPPLGEIRTLCQALRTFDNNLVARLDRVDERISCILERLGIDKQ